MSIKFETFRGTAGGVTGGLVYKGSYNATTSTPSLVTAEKGDFYIVSVAGSLAGVTLNVGDHIVFNQDAANPVTSAMFDVIDNTDAVSSVNGQTGVVVLDSDNVTEGSSNLYFTNTRADGRIAAANLTDLNDVDYTAGAGINGYVLEYVHANNQWEAKAAASAPVTSVNTQTGAVVLDTDDVSEGSSNLYYTNARFDTQLGTKTTDNVSEGSSNLYYTNARFDTQLGTKTTDNVSEGSSNLYYTNARADGRIAAATANDLSDVSYTAGAGIDGQFLKYVHANNQWEASSVSTGGLTYSSVAVGDSPVTGAVSTHYSANTSGGLVNIALPAIAAGNAGNEIRVKLKTAGNNLTLTPDGTDTVEGGGAGVAYTLSIQNQAVTLVSDGSGNWEVI